MTTPARLTPRGRWVIAALAVLIPSLMVLGLVNAVNSQFPLPSLPASTPSTTPGPAAVTSSPPPSQTAAGSPSAAPSTAAPSRTKTSSAPKPSTSKVPDPEPSETMVTSNTASSGRYTASTSARPASVKTSSTHTYVVKVETTLREDPNQVAAQLHAILTDRRGWAGFEGHSFALVAESAQPEFTIYLASPRTVDQLCAPATPHRTWNCRVGSRVVLNIDRWLHATPTWSGRPIAEYRAYMLNHEVGHYIGKGHVACPGKGQPAPVMMQQSITLGGCAINAWPRPNR